MQQGPLRFIVPAIRMGCFVIIFLSVTVLIGWFANIALLKSILPGILPMNPLEAICFLFTGIVLLLRVEQNELTTSRFVIVDLLSAVVLVIGIGAFANDFFPLGVRLDNFFSFWGADQSIIAPNSAFNFILFGLALFVINKKRIIFEKTQVFVLTAGIITMFAGIGYLYNAISFYKISTHSPMPLNTACAFALLCACTLLSTHNQGMMKILTEDFIVSKLARRFVLASIVLPVMLGVVGTMTGKFFDTQAVTAFLVVSQIIIFTVIIWVTTRILYRNELDRQNMTQDLKSKNTRLEETSFQLKQKMQELEVAEQKIRDLLNHEKTLQEVNQ